LETFLREALRAGKIECRCMPDVRGFRVTGNPPYLLYDGKREGQHELTCEWVNAVNEIYKRERKCNE
jgi:hypothetical protein